jgi:hypothetical protein
MPGRGTIGSVGFTLPKSSSFMKNILLAPLLLILALGSVRAASPNYVPVFVFRMDSQGCKKEDVITKIMETMVDGDKAVANGELDRRVASQECVRFVKGERVYRLPLKPLQPWDKYIVEVRKPGSDSHLWVPAEALEALGSEY